MRKVKQSQFYSIYTDYENLLKNSQKTYAVGLYNSGVGE